MNDIIDDGKVDNMKSLLKLHSIDLKLCESTKFDVNNKAYPTMLEQYQKHNKEINTVTAVLQFIADELFKQV